MNREGRIRGILARLVGHLDAALLANPYLIVYRTGLDGLGDPHQFDALVLSELGLDPHDARRLEFLAWIVLSEATSEGHTAVPVAWATRTLARLARTTEEVAAETLRNTVRMGAVTATRAEGGVVFVQLAPLARAEGLIATFAARRLAKKE